MLNKISNKDWKVILLLFLCTFLYYFIYLKEIFLNANSLLSTIHGDSTKNYFVYLYHITVDKSFINFTGLNYPFGEHLLYTDCQPLLTFIFKLLPFTHNYLIGILHLLILFSYIITPCIYYKIFKLFKVNTFVAFCSGFAIVILSPQLMRIGGHFGLSYACFTPLLIYFLVKYSLYPSNQLRFIVLIFNFLLFFMHPYIGIGSCLLTLLYLVLFEFTGAINWRKGFTSIFFMGLIPIILFRVFMLLTDTHVGRSDYPYGVDVYISGMSSIFVSYFGGPFSSLMCHIIKVDDSREWEGIAYIGFFMILLIALTILLAIIFLKKYRFNKICILLLACGIVMLLMSFGLHTKLLKKLNIEIASLNQFRAAGRFAWFFYYSIPIFIIVSLNDFFVKFFNKHSLKWMGSISILFLSFNMLEGHYYFNMIFSNTFNVKNVFNYKKLSRSEKKLIKQVKALNPQAILPMPFYHYGSEVISRKGTESCYISMIVAYHCKLPIIGAFLSRTSVPESVDEIALLNQYIKHDSIFKKFDNRSIALIKTPVESYMMLDEINLMKRAKFINNFKDYTLYEIDKKVLDFDETMIDSSYKRLVLKGNYLDTLGIKFIKTENRKPFTTSVEKDYETLFSIDKGQYPPGKYVLSFHYHFKEFMFKYLTCNFIAAKDDGIKPVWEFMTGVRWMHTYNDLIVFEIEINIDANSKYNFLLNGGGDETYYVSDFLLRPYNTNVIMKINGKTTLINNHPLP